MGRLHVIDGRGERLESIVSRIARPYSLSEYVEKVRPIVEDVRARGYTAVREYSERFDSRSFDDPRVPREELEEALREVGDEACWALRVAARMVERYSRAILPRGVAAGGLGLLWRPVERVGVYVPAGAKPYPSTLIMAAVPARVAGVEFIAAVTPPSRDEAFMAHPLVEAAAAIAGVDVLVAVGGAQAVAALAYGATPVPKVDKIVGPGSPYVEAAKLLVASEVGVDMAAGPSEIAIVADDAAKPRLVALDLLAQAEHGPLSTALLVTPSTRLAGQVAGIVGEAVEGEHMGVVYIVTVDTLLDAVELVNLYAPEHLELIVEEPGELLARVRSAGAVSVGQPVAYMDYAAGPSHILPTGSAARWRGGLSVYDFLKPIAVVSEADGEALEAAITLARLEGFKYHAMSLEAWRNA